MHPVQGSEILGGPMSPMSHNPFSSVPPARTPGTLGIRDAASPHGAAEIGETPGTLGRNDHAEASANSLRGPSTSGTSETARWLRFLDSLVDWKTVSGPQLAWESSAHLVITHRAVGSSILRDMLPISDVRDRLLWVLSGLPQDVVWTDITPEQFSDKKRWKGITSKAGQATHFMAYKGQSQRDAYEWGMEKIFGQVEEAVKKMRESSEKRGSGDELSSPLAHAIHTLQDSFSPAHVQRARKYDRWVIVQLFVWNEQSGEEHEAGDVAWKQPGEKASENTKLSDLGNACFEATMLLLRYYVYCVVNRSSDAERVKKDLVYQYLTYTPPVFRPNLPPASDSSGR